MNYIKDKGTYTSSDGTSEIAYYVYTPTCGTRAILQISHGMCEYIEGKYEEFAEFLCENGIAMCGNDHIGHGYSVKSLDELGHIEGENSWRFMMRDLRTLTRMMKQENEGTPYFLFGHSMGSFLARAYIADFREGLTGCILCGTNGGESLAKLGVGLCRKMIEAEGSRFRSNIVNKLSMDMYNEKIKDKRTDYDWTSRDPAKVDENISDERLNYMFTAGGNLNLVQMLEYVSRDDWAGEVEKGLPILLMSGDCDPVGNYGKGVEKVYEKLKAAGASAEMKLYGGARHELINEINRKEVYNDILSWINTKIQGE